MARSSPHASTDCSVGSSLRTSQPATEGTWLPVQHQVTLPPCHYCLFPHPPPPLLTFVPKENIGLQGAGVHIGDRYKHIPQGGVSDFCNLLLGEQPKWEKDRCWDRKRISVLQGPQAQGLMSRKRLEWTEGCGRALDSSLWGLSRVRQRVWIPRPR